MLCLLLSSECCVNPSRPAGSGYDPVFVTDTQCIDIEALCAIPSRQIGVCTGSV